MEVRLEHLTAGLRLQEPLHLAVGDPHPGRHAALLQPGHHHFVAYLLAEAGPVVAVGAQGIGELLQGHVVLPGDAGQRLVEGAVVDADTGPFRHLQLQTLQDYPVQHLLAQHLAGRQRAVVTPELGGDFVHPFLQLAFHDHAVVDHRHDAVEHFHLGMDARGQQNRRAQQPGCQRPNHTHSCIRECCVPAGNPPGRRSRPARSFESVVARWCPLPAWCHRLRR